MDCDVEQLVKFVGEVRPLDHHLGYAAGTAEPDATNDRLAFLSSLR